LQFLAIENGIAIDYPAVVIYDNKKIRKQKRISVER
jgi:hypothetical protein